jgi:hypothetical protein
VPLCCTLIGVFLTSSFIQFSSTWLLSDIYSIAIPGVPSEETLTYGFSTVHRSTHSRSNTYKVFQDLKYWKFLATEYPAFGESSVPEKRQEGVDDTGTVIRAMIPVGDRDSRERLKYYAGPGYVFDARTVCVQPNIIFTSTAGLYDTDTNLELVVAPLDRPENAVLTASNASVICNLAENDPEICKEEKALCDSPIWTMCNMNYNEGSNSSTPPIGGLIPALDVTNNVSLQHSVITVNGHHHWLASNGDITWPVSFGGGYVLTNFAKGHLHYFLHGFSLNESNKFTYTGPWTEFELPAMPEYNLPTQKIRTSLCFNALWVLFRIYAD